MINLGRMAAASTAIHSHIFIWFGTNRKRRAQSCRFLVFYGFVWDAPTTSRRQPAGICITRRLQQVLIVNAAVLRTHEFLHGRYISARETICGRS